MGQRKIRRALMSVSDKTGLIPFARLLKRWGVEIISTGGSAALLRKSGIPVQEVSEVTGLPEMLDGRVKTLHPRIHAGLLALRNEPAHLKTLKKHGIVPIDLVVVNLYPFEETIAQPKIKLNAAIEQIDIGGPSMVRSAAKNYESVAVVTSPAQYGWVGEELRKQQGKLSLATREKLALAAFQLTGRYDVAIARYLASQVDGEGGPFSEQFSIVLKKLKDLRYGENPHQRAAFYRLLDASPTQGLAGAIQLHGKELSYNNIMDADAAWKVCQYFMRPTVAVIKHANPCGVGTARTIARAYDKAYQADPVSAFGGIVALNRELDGSIAKKMKEVFLEVVVAPVFSKQALRILKHKKNLRLLQIPSRDHRNAWNFAPGLDYRPVTGGFLVQDADEAELTMSDVKVVTKREPTLAELEDLFFAWGVAKHVKSNAIVLVKEGKTWGIGAGQMSRVDAAEIAIRKMKKRVRGTVMASDGFFPFPDSVELAGKAGVTALIQPGGSIRDPEVIHAANDFGLAMVFTGRRHFRH